MKSLTELPHGTKGKSVEAHSASYWTRTARLITEKDGSETLYFLKVMSPSNFAPSSFNTFGHGLVSAVRA